jgi:hypothetical protein
MPVRRGGCRCGSKQQELATVECHCFLEPRAPPGEGGLRLRWLTPHSAQDDGVFRVTDWIRR